VTPLHFPLEGTTEGSGLSYFDIHLDEFRTRLKNGGHAIIGSHPDLDQSGLEHLVSREGFNDVWYTTVDSAVARARAVLSSGKVCLLVDAEGREYWVSEEHLADLQIVEYARDGSSSIMRVQLLRNRPRPSET
jgi:hypothetical protein